LGQFRIEKGFRGRAGSNGKEPENYLERPGKGQGKGEGTGSSEKEPENYIGRTGKGKSAKKRETTEKVGILR
jgi:hypothetical protein